MSESGAIRGSDPSGRMRGAEIPLRPRIGVTLMLDLAEQDDHLPRYGMNRTYFAAIRRAGGIPVALAPGDARETDLYIPPADAPFAAPRLLDGLCLTGGGDLAPRYYGQERRPGCKDPDDERDEMELALIAAARPRGLPILALCRGIQVLNAALGGTLIQDIALERPASLDHAHHPGRARDELVHEILITPDSRLREIIGADVCAVNSLHHQAVERIASGLRVAARAADGIIEALEPPAGRAAFDEEIGRGEFLLGVQFHPEDLQGHEAMRRIFAFFVRAAAAYRALHP